MRVLNKDLLELPEGWEERAQAARDAGPAEVNNNASLWQECKPCLKRISYNKCFYCEVKQIRSDNAVDHFRPKKHYPWSAFDPLNFRFACTYCNSRRKDIENGRTGGKGDYFPLLVEDNRATCCEEECNEAPVLLDPYQSDEPSLIDFTDDGRPIPTFTSDQHVNRHRRAAESIRLYHLDHQDLVDKRLTLAAEITSIVETTNRLFPKTEAGDPDVDSAFKENVRLLGRMMLPDAELSSFARRMLDGYRHYVWVPGILRTLN